MRDRIKDLLLVKLSIYLFFFFFFFVVGLGQIEVDVMSKVFKPGSVQGQGFGF